MSLSPSLRSFMTLFAALLLISSSLQASTKHHTLHHKHAHKHAHKQPPFSSSEHLIANLPWQRVTNDNDFKYKFIIMNYSPDNFKSAKVKKIAETVEKYVAKYVYPNWQLKCEIEVFTPESNPDILTFGTSLDPKSAKGTYIPIYLVDNFNPNVGNNFGISIHGNVSGSVMNGPDALTYLPPPPPSNPTYPNPNLETPTLYTAIPYGTPFIVIPAGSTTTGNGINAAVARNQVDPSLGPTDFYQEFALTLSHEVIEVLINPTGALYNGGGDPLGSAQDQFFFIVEAVDPFSIGKDNIVKFNGWAMTNFAFPAYFFPYNTSGKYDLLNRSSAPFTPYKGSQFFLYQTATSDLQAGAYVSSPSDPDSIQFVLNGSIYTYTGWGLKVDKSDASGTRYLGVNEGVHARRQQLDLVQATNMAKSVKLSHNVKEKKKRHAKKHKPSKKPHLLPFQYLDEDGVVVTRFKILNFIPDVLPPSLIKPSIPCAVEYLNNRFFPYWNKKVSAEYFTYPNLPKFDGSFIPFYFLPTSMANLSTPFGVQFSSSASADNLNNVPNALAGPLLTDYVTGLPSLPLGNPYMISNELTYQTFALEEFMAVISHEMAELTIDPTYAFYYATSNPPEDHAILFSQWEMSDPEEVDSQSQTCKHKTYSANPFVLPSYFFAYLNNSLYDNTGFGYRALVPSMPRQQIVWQQQGEPMQVAFTINNLDGAGDLSLWNVGNIFDPNTYFYSSFDIIPIPSTPLAPIYQRLQTPKPLY